MNNILLIIVLIIIGGGLAYASWKEYITNPILDLLDKLASILSFLLAIFLLFSPFIGLGPSSDLYILSEGGSSNTYLIAGDNVEEYFVGDNLVVYDVLIRDAEIPIALLHVIAQNPTTLSVQPILVHPEYEIRANLRVDNSINQLSKSELVPSYESGLGYLIEEGLVRLRPNVSLEENDIIEPLESQIIDGKIVDYLPFTPTIQMRVANIGGERVISKVELMTGKWPDRGTIVSLISETVPNKKITQPTPLAITPSITTPIENKTPNKNTEPTPLANDNTEPTPLAREITAEIDSFGTKGNIVIEQMLISKSDSFYRLEVTVKNSFAHESLIKKIKLHFNKNKLFYCLSSDTETYIFSDTIHIKKILSENEITIQSEVRQPQDAYSYNTRGTYYDDGCGSAQVDLEFDVSLVLDAEKFFIFHLLIPKSFNFNPSDNSFFLITDGNLQSPLTYDYMILEAQTDAHNDPISAGLGLPID